MNFTYSDKVISIQQQMEAFFAEHIMPNEQRFHDEIEANTKAGKRWTPVQLLDELKPKAQAAGLWNLFMPGKHGAGLTNLEYAPLAEITGWFIGHPKSSIALRPIPAIWRFSPNTVPKNNRSSG